MDSPEISRDVVYKIRELRELKELKTIVFFESAYMNMRLEHSSLTSLTPLTPLTSLFQKRNHSSYPLGLFFWKFQLSRHISSIPNFASQPNSALALAGSQ